MEDILPAAELSQATVREARVFATSVALDRGDGTYALAPLPTEAQLAPVYASLVRDFDGDGHPDILLAGNLYGVQPVMGQYDASSGLLLHGLGDGRFRPDAVGPLGIDGEVRHLKTVRRSDGSALVAVARNNNSLVILQPAQSKPTR